MTTSRGRGADRRLGLGRRGGAGDGSRPYVRHHLTDRLPLHSPVFGAAALSVVVAVPHTVTGRYAWRGRRTAVPPSMR
jgi:hypothetical protein